MELSRDVPPPSSPVPVSCNRRVPPPSRSRHSSLSTQKEQERPFAARIAEGAVTVTALGLANCALSASALAWGETWRPRRHRRRMDEWERKPDLGKYTPVSLWQKDPLSILSRVDRLPTARNYIINTFMLLKLFCRRL